MKGGDDMKKILFLTVMLSAMLVFGMVGVLAASQTVTFNPTGVVNFAVSPSLTFPAAIPGTDTSADSTLTLGATNNEDLSVSIILQADSNPIFTNVKLSTLDSTILGLSGTPNLTILPTGTPISITLKDVDAEGVQTVQDKVITATLSVPLGTLPTVKTGTIIYTATGIPPA